MSAESKRPKMYLDYLDCVFPGAFAQVDALKQELIKNSPQKLPTWCFLPSSSSVHALSRSMGISPIEFNDYSLELTQYPPIFSALAAWRVTKGVYRFDNDVYPYVADSSISSNVPVDSFYRMPEWCVYIETPSLKFMGKEAHGFWAYLDIDIIDGKQSRQFLIIVIDVLSPTESMPIPIGIDLSNGSIEECLVKYLDCLSLTPGAAAEVLDKRRNALLDGGRGEVKALSDALKPYLSMLLYICSQDQEIEGDVGFPSNPPRKKTVRGMRHVPAKAISEWKVGVRTGSALRLAYERSNQNDAVEGNHKSARPHVRRAHWHGFWKGSKAPGREDERIFELKWLPPIPVNVSDADNLPAVIKRVDQDTRKGMK